MSKHHLRKRTYVSQQCFTVWLTGMSGAGKTTLAYLILEHLHQMNVRAAVLDGDATREQFWPELGFSKKDRDANVRRLGSLCELLSRNGIVSIVAAISPYRAAREEVRSRLHNFVEVHVQCSLSVLVERDPKGLYKRAVKGEITGFTGISDPYEPPLSPEVTVISDSESPEASAIRILNVLGAKQLVEFPYGLDAEAQRNGLPAAQMKHSTVDENEDADSLIFHAAPQSSTLFDRSG